MIQLNSITGPINICTLWDFMTEVRKERIYADNREQIEVIRQDGFGNSSFDMTMNYDMFRNPQAMEVLYSKTSHLLKLNPMSVLVELKKTTTLKYKQAKRVDCEDMLHSLCTEAAHHFGHPTHFFPIGTNLYALISLNDVRLFIAENWTQSLVCLNSKRNFTVYAPNLKVNSR